MPRKITLTYEQKCRVLASVNPQSYDNNFTYGLNILNDLLFISIPRKFNSSSLDAFLVDIDFVFKQVTHPSAILSLRETNEISILGLIIIYKFIAYTATHRTFQVASVDIPQKINRRFEEIGLSNLINSYIVKSDRNSAFNNLKKVTENSFFIYPQKLVRREEHLDENIRSLFCETISEFYTAHGKANATGLLSTCIGELIMNFWEHATDESETVVTAHGTLNTFKIVLADNGQGIATTLSSTSSKSKEELISSCIRKGVTSKKHSYHMGFGLYYVSELTKLNDGTLNIWSEGYRLTTNRKRSSIRKTGHWKGTIIELHLDLSKPKNIQEMQLYKGFKPSIKINFGGQS